MKKLILLLVLICLAGWTRDLLDSSAVRHPSEIIRPGEKFIYQASVYASKITIHQSVDIFLWTDSLIYYDNSVFKDSCYHFTFFTRIDPPNEYISLIESKIESYSRQKDLASLRFEKHIIEKEKERQMIINFDLDRQKAYYEKDLIVFNDSSVIDSSGIAVFNYFELHDFVNIFYYLRLLKEYQIGKKFCIRSFAENQRKIYRLPIVILKEETITVPAGKFDCYLIKCCVKDIKLFNINDIYLWITKDERKIITRIDQKHKVGPFSVTLSLRLKSLNE